MLSGATDHATRSKTLGVLLAKCPVLRSVKAWGIGHAADSLVGFASLTGGGRPALGEDTRRPGPGRRSPRGARVAPPPGGASTVSPAAAARAMRSAYAARGIDLLWTDPIPPPYVGEGVVGAAGARRPERDGADGKVGATSAAACRRAEALGMGMEVGMGMGLPGRGEAVVHRRFGEREPCPLGCGAQLRVEDAADHPEVGVSCRGCPRSSSQRVALDPSPPPGGMKDSRPLGAGRQARTASRPVPWRSGHG